MNFTEYENELISLHQHVSSGSCYEAANSIWRLLFADKKHHTSIPSKSKAMVKQLDPVGSNFGYIESEPLPHRQLRRRQH
jgi:hypothetical protein